MRTINGKLIIQEQKQLDILQEQTLDIIQHCDSLESKVAILQQQSQGVIQCCDSLEPKFTAMNQQQSIKYLQETSTIKLSMQKLDNRLTSLEQNISKQIKSLSIRFLVINFSFFVGFISPWLWSYISNQDKSHDTKPVKISESTQL
jgi:hypothetical protein